MILTRPSTQAVGLATRIAQSFWRRHGPQGVYGLSENWEQWTATDHSDLQKLIAARAQVERRWADSGLACTDWQLLLSQMAGCVGEFKAFFDYVDESLNAAVRAREFQTQADALIHAAAAIAQQKPDFLVSRSILSQCQAMQDNGSLSNNPLSPGKQQELKFAVSLIQTQRMMMILIHEFKRLLLPFIRTEFKNITELMDSLDQHKELVELFFKLNLRVNEEKIRVTESQFMRIYALLSMFADKILQNDLDGMQNWGLDIIPLQQAPSPHITGFNRHIRLAKLLDAMDQVHCNFNEWIAKYPQRRGETNVRYRRLVTVWLSLCIVAIPVFFTSDGNVVYTQGSCSTEGVPWTVYFCGLLKAGLCNSLDGYQRQNLKAPFAEEIQWLYIKAIFSLAAVEEHFRRGKRPKGARKILLEHILAAVNDLIRNQDDVVSDWKSVVTKFSTQMSDDCARTMLQYMLRKRKQLGLKET